MILIILSDLVKDAEQKRSLVANDLAQLAENQVPALIKDSAELQVSKILRGDYNLKIARQDYFTSNQDQVTYPNLVPEGGRRSTKIWYPCVADVMNARG